MRRAETALALALLASACATAPAPSAQPDALAAAIQGNERDTLDRLPPGDGRNAVMGSCLICHSAGIIVAQRKDAAAWQRTVRQMVTWGAPVQPGQEELITAYLAQHFGQSR